MSGFGDGYVGNSADVARIRRVEKQREEAKKKYEEQAKAQREKAEAAALRQFGASTSEVRERFDRAHLRRRSCPWWCRDDAVAV